MIIFCLKNILRLLSSRTIAVEIGRSECFHCTFPFSSMCSYLPATEANGLVTLLCEIITDTKEKNTCSHALWCLGKQSVSHDIISAEVGVDSGMCVYMHLVSTQLDTINRMVTCCLQVCRDQCKLVLFYFIFLLRKPA